MQSQKVCSNAKFNVSLNSYSTQSTFNFPQVQISGLNKAFTLLFEKKSVVQRFGRWSYHSWRYCLWRTGKGRGLFAWMFSVIRSTVQCRCIYVGRDKTLDQTRLCRNTRDSPLAYSFKTLPAKHHAQHSIKHIHIDVGLLSRDTPRQPNTVHPWCRLTAIVLHVTLNCSIPCLSSILRCACVWPKVPHVATRAL